MIEALGYVKDLGRFDFKATQGFMEVGRSGFVTAKLFGSDDVGKSDLKVLLSFSEQGVVYVGKNHQGKMLLQPTQSGNRI